MEYFHETMPDTEFPETTRTYVWGVACSLARIDFFPLSALSIA